MMSCVGVMYQPYSTASNISPYLPQPATPTPAPPAGASPPTTSPTAANAAAQPTFLPDNNGAPLPLKREITEKVIKGFNIQPTRALWFLMTSLNTWVSKFMSFGCNKVCSDRENATFYRDTIFDLLLPWELDAKCYYRVMCIVKRVVSYFLNWPKCLT